MAEYYMTYNEISDELDKFLAESENISNISKYKAEVLAAITGNYTPNDLDSVHQMVELWQNQIAHPSKLLLGDRYIRVQSMMLEFLAAACTSGLLDSIIASVSAGTLTGFSISVGSSIFIAIWELLNSVKKLDNWDFCVYMQAVTHFHKHQKFSESDLISWFPDNSSNCNMHNDKWDCDYLNANDTCDMLSAQHIKDALDSLLSKNLLKKEKENGVYVYHFKR